MESGFRLVWQDLLDGLAPRHVTIVDTGPPATETAGDRLTGVRRHRKGKSRQKRKLVKNEMAPGRRRKHRSNSKPSKKQRQRRRTSDEL